METEQRINWIKYNIKGKNILNLGIDMQQIDIMLAKDGRQILSICLNKQIADDLNNNLSKSKETPKNNITYTYGDFFTYDFKDVKFDSIIISGQHDEDEAGELLKKAKKLLRPDGRVILSMLLCKENISTGNLYDLGMVSEYFHVQNIEIVEDTWFNVVCADTLKEGSHFDFVFELEKLLAGYVDDLKTERAKLLKQKEEADRKEDEFLEENEILIDRIQAERMERKKHEEELQYYKNQYDKISSSKRYKIGTIISKIYANPFSIFHYFKKILFKTKHKIIALMPEKKSYYDFDGVSVIIPTYKEQIYFDECINSVLKQTLDPSKIEIIISVNGKDKEYYEKLKEKYKEISRIKVIYTPVPGASAGRNNAIDFVTKDYLTYLDDDDYFTEGYLEELTSHLGKNINIVCGRLFDSNNGRLNTNTYINRELSKIDGGKTKDYFFVGSLFSPVAAKIYRSELFKSTFSKFDETVSHTEDVLFWADNFDKLKEYIYCCKAKGKEALIRRVLEDSMSRPSQEKLFSFWIKDRIDIINYISEKIFNQNLTSIQKRFLLNKINSQVDAMLKYYHTLEGEEKRQAFALVCKADNFYLNKGKFSDAKGIAFCHNFSPSSDASAYVAVKRLCNINKIENSIIDWIVVSSNMSNCRELDKQFDEMFTKYVISKNIILPGPSYFNEKAQSIFAQEAYKAVKNIRADYIYSRSMYAGSHKAAYKYKQKYPDVKWFAEFSDPIFMDTDNKKRENAKKYKGGESFLNDFWKTCETDVYKLADVIIFTNENQRKYMLDYNEDKALNDRVLEKSIILKHPILEQKFCNIIDCDYSLDKTKINIGYFGSFYANRKYTDMLNLLINKDVVLHLFVPNPEELVINKRNIRINSYVGHFEFLNIASKMDYLYLNDIDFDGEINPYLPSKLADYLASGAKIIAKTNDNTMLSEYQHENIIKTKRIDAQFVRTLARKVEMEKYLYDGEKLPL